MTTLGWLGHKTSIQTNMRSWVEPRWRWNSAHDCIVLYCTEPFIIILPPTWYGVNNVERDVKHQIVIIIITASCSVLLRYLCNSTLHPSGGGWVGRRCPVSYLKWGVQLILAYSWARSADKGRGGMFLFLLFLQFHSYSSFFPLFHLLYCLFYLFSLSLGDDTKWPTRGDVSLNPNTINQHYTLPYAPNSPFSFHIFPENRIKRLAF